MLDERPSADGRHPCVSVGAGSHHSSAAPVERLTSNSAIDKHLRQR